MALFKIIKYLQKIPTNYEALNSTNYEPGKVILSAAEVNNPVVLKNVSAPNR